MLELSIDSDIAIVTEDEVNHKQPLFCFFVVLVFTVPCYFKLGACP